MIAARQTQADLFGPHPGPRPGPGPPRKSAPAPAATTFYLHLSLADLLGLSQAGPGRRPARSARWRSSVRPRKIRDWVAHSQVTIRPVLDLARTDAVDQHDPPEWMREQVILRDRHCVFPWCARDARSCDLDHIEPYVTRRRRTTRPDPPREPRPAVPATSPLQDLRTLALPTPPRRHLHLAVPPGPQLPGSTTTGTGTTQLTRPAAGSYPSKTRSSRSAFQRVSAYSSSTSERTVIPPPVPSS